jgi:hypothetical protein
LGLWWEAKSPLAVESGYHSNVILKWNAPQKLVHEL